MQEDSIISTHHNTCFQKSNYTEKSPIEYA
jgi:hypothetical protein